MNEACAINGEIVEALEPRRVVEGFVKVKLAVARQEGWIPQQYLHTCPEGTSEHGRTAAAGRLKQTKLDPSHPRFREIQKIIQNSWCVPGGCSQLCGKNGCAPAPSANCIKAYKGSPKWEIEEVTFLEGQFLGETGMVTGEKEVLFHGCKDSTIPLILENGFDLSYSSPGAFGKGNYFTPQACKAFSYSYDKSASWFSGYTRGRHILVCEVALGAVDKRMILTTPDRSLDREQVCFQQGFRSTVHHVDGGYFQHEERVIYWNTQCKPVYLVKMKGESPASGV
jgi:hypothetical protein